MPTGVDVHYGVRDEGSHDACVDDWDDVIGIATQQEDGLLEVRQERQAAPTCCRCELIQ